MVSADRGPIVGVWGRSPTGGRRFGAPVVGPEAEPLIRGSCGQSHSEAETLLAFARSMESANLPTFLKFGNAENHCGHICVVSAKYYTAC